MKLELSASAVLEYLKFSNGSFSRREMQEVMNVITPEGKDNLRQILHRLCDTGVIAKTGLDGTYRKIDNERKVIDWQNADASAIFPIKWPFGLEEYASMYPKNIAIVAGSKQEGKTTFLLNTLKANLHLADRYKIELFNSETGAEQLQDRAIGLGIPFDAPFTVFERYDNFADVIDPDAITIIDYLDMNQDFFMAGVEIDKIFRKLNKGIAIIGMQIPPPAQAFVKGVKKTLDRDLAYGGGTTAKRAFIYLSMSSHKLKLKYAKKPTNPRVHPENMTWSYSFDEQGDFCNVFRDDLSYAQVNGGNDND